LFLLPMHEVVTLYCTASARPACASGLHGDDETPSG
jgi:hypothetical protein